MDASQIASYAAKALGAGNNGLTVAVAVALAESGGASTATNRNSDGSIDTGLWQINSVHKARHPTWTIDWLKNPANNAAAMAIVSSNGTNWEPWSVWWEDPRRRTGPGKGKYLDHWDAAAKATGAHGSVGIPGPGDVIGPVVDTAMAIPEAIQNAAQAFLDLANKVGGWVAEPHNWTRVGFVIGGALLVVLAGSAIASDTKAGQAVTGAVGTVATRRPATRR